MLAVAISVLFAALALFALRTIAVSLVQGLAAGREIVAELARLECVNNNARPQAIPPLRGRSLVSQPGYSRQPVRLRPLRRAFAAA